MAAAAGPLAEAVKIMSGANVVKLVSVVKATGEERGKQSLDRFNIVLKDIKWLREKGLTEEADKLTEKYEEARKEYGEAWTNIGQKKISEDLQDFSVALRTSDETLKKIKDLYEKSVMDFSDTVGTDMDLGLATVQDALITKKGEVIKFNPRDNILATQSPVAQTKDGAVATAGGAQMAGGGYSGPSVVQVNLHLDGKKIAEQQVRLSRTGA
jgi:hypothetical protein